MIRMNLKILRIKNGLTQDGMAKRLNYSRSQYTAVELGHRSGTDVFWYAVQREFNIPDAEMWGLKSCE